MISRLVTRLNLRISEAASAANVWSVRQAVRDRFAGHNACDYSSEWIHAGNLDLGGGILNMIDAKTFHPKNPGQVAYAFAFSDELLYWAG